MLGGVYDELIKRLKFDPDRLVVGELPVAEKKEETNPIRKHDERSKKAQKIVSALNERNEKMAEEEKKHNASIYYVGESYDREKAKKARKNAAKKFRKGVLEEVTHDVASVTGGLVGLSAFAAVDTKHDVSKAIGATTLGSTSAKKSLDSIVYYGEEGYDTAMSIKEWFKDHRNGEPIRLNKDKKK